MNHLSLSLSLSRLLCLFREVWASNDASLLYHKLFSLYVHMLFICSYSMSLLFIQSIIVALCLPQNESWHQVKQTTYHLRKNLPPQHLELK